MEQAKRPLLTSLARHFFPFPNFLSLPKQPMTGSWSVLGSWPKLPVSLGLLRVLGKDFKSKVREPFAHSTPRQCQKRTWHVFKHSDTRQSCLEIILSELSQRVSQIARPTRRQACDDAKRRVLMRTSIIFDCGANIQHMNQTSV